MPHPRAEVFWQIPHHLDWQGNKWPTNARDGGEDGNWPSIMPHPLPSPLPPSQFIALLIDVLW